MPNYITAVRISNHNYLRIRDYPHLDNTQVYCGAQLGKLPIVESTLDNGDVLYSAQAPELGSAETDTAIAELSTLEFVLQKVKR